MGKGSQNADSGRNAADAQFRKRGPFNQLNCLRLDWETNRLLEFAGGDHGTRRHVFPKAARTSPRPSFLAPSVPPSFFLPALPRVRPSISPPSLPSRSTSSIFRADPIPTDLQRWEQICILDQNQVSVSNDHILESFKGLEQRYSSTL